MNTQSEMTMSCSFLEISQAASSHRAEALGMYSIHAFIDAVVRFYQVNDPIVDIRCNNDAVVKTSCKDKTRIPPSSKCADIFRGIGNIKQGRPHVRWSYMWVQSHMDDIIEWEDLTRNQQLNVLCDSLTKEAAMEGIAEYPIGSQMPCQQLLPHENIALFVESEKLTTDPGPRIQFSRGEQEGRNFLMSEIGWSSSRFNEVDWENLHLCLHSKPDGFGTWLAKQHSNFSATQLQTNR